MRKEGILIVGSGIRVHNFHAYAWGVHTRDPCDWAIRFEERAKELMLAGEDRSLIGYETPGREALLSVSTPDHYLPLLYVPGTRQQNQNVTFPVEGVNGGSMSMPTFPIARATATYCGSRCLER
jgi:4,5-DOPA dioxygenase extradiol